MLVHVRVAELFVFIFRRINPPAENITRLSGWESLRRYTSLRVFPVRISISHFDCVCTPVDCLEKTQVNQSYGFLFYIQVDCQGTTLRYTERDRIWFFFALNNIKVIQSRLNEWCLEVHVRVRYLCYQTNFQRSFFLLGLRLDELQGQGCCHFQVIVPLPVVALFS